MSELSVSGDTIELVPTTPPTPNNVVLGGNIHNNIIVIKSRIPGVDPKIFVIQTFNRKLTKGEIDSVILRERAKMEAEAVTTVTDVSDNTVSVTDVSGEEVL